MPAGTYVFNAYDMCGILHVLTIEVVLSDRMGTPPYFTLTNQTCVSATVFIYDIQQLIMNSAPPAYNVPLPRNYSNLINFAGYAVFTNLPVGTYVFSVIDKCGNPQPFTVIIAPQSSTPTVLVLEGCAIGVGSLQISGQMTSISLIAAPPAYTSTLPVNLTSSIISNKLTLDNLPPGNYSFISSNACNLSYTINATVLGYTDNSNAIVTANCGSFNLSLTHTINNSRACRKVKFLYNFQTYRHRRACGYKNIINF